MEEIPPQRRAKEKMMEIMKKRKKIQVFQEMRMKQDEGNQRNRIKIHCVEKL